MHHSFEVQGVRYYLDRALFLLMPLLAIARIDRMGQTRPTEGNHSRVLVSLPHACFLVYCYYAEDTVERNILDLAARQGLSLYTKENAAGTVNVSSFAADNDKTAVDAPIKKAQKGDFIFK